MVGKASNAGVAAWRKAGTARRSEEAAASWTVNVSMPEAEGRTRLTDLETMDEESLVRACVEGHPEAFDEIVARHRRLVYQVCYRFAGNAEDAADLAQDVFLRAYRAIGRFKGQSSLPTWLYRIAVNACLNKVGERRGAMEPLDQHGDVAAAGPDAVGQLLAEERASQVRAAIARLPEKQRATLILRIYQELSHREIAVVLGSSEGAVKTNFFHALKNLRRLLGGRGR